MISALDSSNRVREAFSGGGLDLGGLEVLTLRMPIGKDGLDSLLTNADRSGLGEAPYLFSSARREGGSCFASLHARSNVARSRLNPTTTIAHFMMV